MFFILPLILIVSLSKIFWVHDWSFKTWNTSFLALWLYAFCQSVVILMLLIRLIARCYSAIINWVDFSLLKPLIPFLYSSFLMFQLQYIIKSFLFDPIYLDLCRYLIPRWTYLCLSLGKFLLILLRTFSRPSLRHSSPSMPIWNLDLCTVSQSSATSCSQLLKSLHNFNKWCSSSTFPFSNRSCSSTFSSIPGLLFSPRSILLMRPPLQFLFGLLSLSYPIFVSVWLLFNNV